MNGLLGISLSSPGAVYTGTAGGNLIEIDFKVAPTVPVNTTRLIDLRLNSGIATQRMQIQDSGVVNYTNSPALTTYGGTRTQAGVLTPGGFTPTDADAADAAVQIVAVPPAVTPTAVADKYAMAPNSSPFPASMTVSAAAGVLANDTFSQSGTDRLTAKLVGGTYNAGTNPTYTGSTANGTVTLNATDGSFTYTPNAGFAGVDTFQYQAVAALRNTESAATTVTVTLGGTATIRTAVATASPPVTWTATAGPT